MAFKNRPEHLFNLGTVLKPGNHLPGVFKSRFNARFHRVQTSISDINVVGRCGLPHCCHSVKHLGPGFFVAAHHAHQDVGMSGNVFGGGMHNHIDVYGQGLEVKRRRPRVVDHAPDTMLLAFGSNRRHIRQFKAMRPRSFHHQKRRVGLELLFNIRADIRVEKLYFHTHFHENLFSKVTRGAIDCVHEKRMTPSMHKRKKRRCRARQSRCKRPDARGALERFHSFVKRLMRFRAPDTVRGHILDQLVAMFLALNHVLDRLVQHG